MEGTRVPPGRPLRTTSGMRTTGWESLTCKLLRLLLNMRMVCTTTGLKNSSFALTTNSGQMSRLWYLKNGVPQRSWDPSFSTSKSLNFYPVSKKYAYAGDWAIMHGNLLWCTANCDWMPPPNSYILPQRDTLSLACHT